MISRLQLWQALQAAYDRPINSKWSWFSPARIEDLKALRRIQNDPDLLQLIVDKLNEEPPKPESRFPKSGPWMVTVFKGKKREYVTAAQFTLDDKPIAESILLVNVRGGAHGFSFKDATALVAHFGMENSQADNIHETD